MEWQKLIALVAIHCMLSVGNVWCANSRFLLPMNKTISQRKYEVLTNSVKFGMPKGFFTSHTDCSRNWTRSGWDADVMYILAAHTGNTAGCVNVKKSEVFPNGTLTGGMLDLALGRIDVYGKGKYQEPGLERLATLYPHKQDNMCVMVPKAAFASRRLSMPTFSAGIWAATAASLGAFAAALRAAHGCSGARLFLEVARTFITGAFSRRLRRTLLWLSLLSFFVLSLFAGCFVGALVAPDRGAVIDTLEEVDRVVDVLYAARIAADVVSTIGEDDQPAVFALARKMVVVSDFERATRDAAQSARKGMLASTTALRRFQTFPGASRDGYSLFYEVPECVLAPAYYTFAVRKDWPLKHEFTRLLLQLVEGGVFTKLFIDGFEKLRMESSLIRLEDGNPPIHYQALTTINLGPLFILWVAGLVIALIVFLIEICVQAKKKPKNIHVSKKK